nr:hypothetical protein Itr_chr13CG02560 [Ipomoea trifida]
MLGSAATWTLKNGAAPDPLPTTESRYDRGCAPAFGSTGIAALAWSATASWLISPSSSVRMGVPRGSVNGVSATTSTPPGETCAEDVDSVCIIDGRSGTAAVTFLFRVLRSSKSESSENR